MLIRKSNGNIVAALTLKSPAALAYLHGGLYDLLGTVDTLPDPEARERARYILAVLLEAVEAPTAPPA